MTAKQLPPPPKAGASAPPPKTALPPPAAGPVAAQPVNPERFAITSGRIGGPQRILLYGPGGIGKSSLAALTPQPVFLDIERGTREIDVPRIDTIETFSDLRACLQSSALDGFATVVIDSATKAEELAVAHALATIPHEKGHRVSSLEGYGFGKGLSHVYDTFLLLLSDLDKQVRAGRNVILVAHDCVADAPNPVGEDFIRYEPHLQSPKSGKASIRNRVVQWADHVLFIGYDVIASEGKGKGTGTRTIWPVERPDHVAKSRSIAEPVQFLEGDGSIWSQVFGAMTEGGAA